MCFDVYLDAPLFLTAQKLKTESLALFKVAYKMSMEFIPRR
jgi:hypothetical protein